MCPSLPAAAVTLGPAARVVAAALVGGERAVLRAGPPGRPAGEGGTRGDRAAAAAGTPIFPPSQILAIDDASKPASFGGSYGRARALHLALGAAGHLVTVLPWCGCAPRRISSPL